MEAFAEFGVGDVDHGGETGGVGVGHLAVHEFLEDGLLLGAGEAVALLDGVPAGGLGEVDGAASVGDGFVAEVGEDVGKRGGDVVVGEVGGNRGDEEGVGAERLDGVAEGLEVGEFCAQETGVIRG